MARAGQFRDRAAFQAEQKVADGGGGSTVAWQTQFTVWAHLIPQRSREQIEAGRLESSTLATLRVRYSSDTAQITSEWRAVVDAVPYNIIAVSQPDRRQRIVEMSVERGVAT